MGKIQTWPLSMLIRARYLLLLMLKKTYEYIEPGAKDHNIRISQPAIVLDERQCSLQIIFRPVGKQPQLAIIFHGTGTILSLDQQLLGTLMFTFYFKKISEWIPNCWTETGLKKFIKEALVQRCSIIKKYLKIPQNSQENTCARFSFLKVAGQMPPTLLKKML